MESSEHNGHQPVPLTAAQRQKLATLRRCRMAATLDRRFARDLFHVREGSLISPWQSQVIDQLHHRYAR